MKKLLGVCVAILIVSFPSNATVPSSVTGTIPEHLRPMLAKIQKEYTTGYWAQKFIQRAELIRKGLLNKQQITTDTVNAPVLMGTYSNSTAKYSTQTFQEMLFDGPNPTGTMTQFYLENSHGKMFMTGKALGWFPAPRTFDYYVHDGGANNAGIVYGGPDFTIDVVVEADKTVDFSKFVKYVDDVGAHVPQIAIIHTGADAAAGADNIWSHRWNIRWRFLQRKNKGSDPYFDVSRVMADGKYITNDSLEGKPVIIDGDYAIQPELAGSNNTSGTPKPIGVFTHEFGHIFGLPDLYDTDYTSAGLGNWCLMAGGSYGGDGSHEGTPAHMSAWCKVKLGWIVPTEVTSFLSQQSIKAVEKYPEIFKINVRNTAGGQYFLVENRQKIGFDKYLLGTGLLIYHIDPAQGSNSNENRRLVDLEQADGLRQLNISDTRGDDGDPFPGSKNNKNFDGYSSPDSRDYSLLQSYVGIRNISASDSIMFADLDAGTRPFIKFNEVSFVESGTHNNNGRVDPGESGTIRVAMENIYPVATSGAVIKFSTSEPDVVIDTAGRNFFLNGLSLVDTVFNISVAPSMQAESRIISVNVTVATGQSNFERSFEVLVGYPGIVLVDMDTTSGENLESKYRSLLQTIGRSYETISDQKNSLNLLMPEFRKTVILFSGRKKSNIISDNLAQELMQILDAGGNVFLTGQNIAEDLSQRNSIYSTSLLKASWKKNVVFGKVLIAVQNDPLGTLIPKLSLAGGDAVPNQTSPDEITVDTVTAHPMYRWNTTSGSNYGGLWWENPAKNSKLVFWSFGLEGANDSAAGITPKSVAVTQVLNWFDGVTSTPEFQYASGIPAVFELRTNFPNPFNPTTSISYSLPTEGIALLKVYDMLGKEVATLVNRKQPAGNYIVRFDASQLSSGIYLYKLTLGNYISTKKMVLLK